MAADDRAGTRSRSRKRTDAPDASPPEREGRAGRRFLLGMAAVGLGCLLAGCFRGGLAWWPLLEACGSRLMGIGCVAGGLLEREWLGRVSDIADGFIPGLGRLFWWQGNDSLSESTLLGRRGARVVWLLFGLPVFAWGC